MDGSSTKDFSQDNQAAPTETIYDDQNGFGMPECAGGPGTGAAPADNLTTAVDMALRDLYEEDASDTDVGGDNSRLIRSFDMIFQLHQRGEEIRGHLENIDRLLFKSRTPAELMERLVDALEHEFDLTAARIHFRPDHPAAQAFRVAPPRGTGIVPDRFIEHEGLFPGGPFVLDDPNGELSRSLFGEATPQLSSAIVANLCVDEEDELGLLCLGSDDPNRYCGGMNTDLIASLAEKIALGIQSAWDHERHARQSVVGCSEGTYTEAFFREYLAKEFNRSWRTRNVFSLMAVSWTSSELESFEQIAEQIRTQVRSSDLVAESDSTHLWILLPDTDLDGASIVAERLSRNLADKLDAELILHCGITSFSKHATTLTTLMSLAQTALQDAVEAGDGRIVVGI